MESTESPSSSKRPVQGELLPVEKSGPPRKPAVGPARPEGAASLRDGGEAGAAAENGHADAGEGRGRGNRRNWRNKKGSGKQKSGKWDKGGKGKGKGKKPSNRKGKSGGLEGLPREDGEEFPIVLDPEQPEGKQLELVPLLRLPIADLHQQAEAMGLENYDGLHRHEIIQAMLRRNAEQNGVNTAEGALEMLPGGDGILRYKFYNYAPSPLDVYVPRAMINKWEVRRGGLLAGPLRPPKDRDRYFGLARIDFIEREAPIKNRERKEFEQLTPMFPKRRIMLENKSGDPSMRLMDLICPIGFGNRGLIVAPPRTGKTVLMKKVANSISENHPNAHLIILLIDERPEEVTDMIRNTKAEVVSSTFDQSTENHILVAEMVSERAKRITETGKDVILLLDSITRLTRAYNNQTGGSGRLMSGGIDAGAMAKPKRFFGAARNLKEGGSLTIIATALIDTGSKMDQLIFEEFKGTGNMEVTLDRNLAEQRIYPAIDIPKSGTRKEELLYHEDEMPRIHALRRACSELMPQEAMELLLKRVAETQNNIEFLMQMKVKELR